MKRITIALSMLIALSTITSAEEDQLTGGFAFLPGSCGENGKANSCKMTFSLTGPSAKAMYDRMRVKAKYDECTEGPVKDDGNGLRCYKSSKGVYECDFGYQFSKRKFTSSDTTC